MPFLYQAFNSCLFPGNIGFRMAAHPLVLGVADALLAPYCERIQLHIGMFRRLCPGETASSGVKSLGVPVKDWDWDTLWLLNIAMENGP